MENIFSEIFKFLGFPEKLLNQCMLSANQQNINSMSEVQIRKNKHIHSGGLSKWKKHFSADNENYFNEKFGSVIEKLGYS